MEEDKDKTSDLDLEALSKLEEGYKTQKEIDAKEAEKNRKAIIAAQMKKEMEQRQAPRSCCWRARRIFKSNQSSTS